MHWWDVTPAPGPGTALVLAVTLAGAGHLRRALTADGALAAVLVGSTVLYWGGWAGGAALATFFVLGSALPHLVAAGAGSDPDPRGQERDAWQVLANGGAAALAATWFRAEPALALWTITASLASASADTWATTIGATSPTPPRRLLLGRPVRPGSNGGMTWRGCAGALGGALVVALAAALVARDWTLLPWATTTGVAGMLLDSILGATLQGRHFAEPCERPSDTPPRGTPPSMGRLAWLDNDGVNFASSAAAALAGALGWHLVRS